MFINNHKKQIRLLCRILFVLYIAGLVYFLFFAEMLDRTGIERSYHYLCHLVFWSQSWAEKKGNSGSQHWRVLNCV